MFRRFILLLVFHVEGKEEKNMWYYYTKKIEESSKEHHSYVSKLTITYIHTHLHCQILLMMNK